MQPQSDDQNNPKPTDDHITVAGLEFEGSSASALESAFATELKAMPTSTPNTNQHANSVFSDKVAKIEHLEEALAKEGEVLKTDIESKIQQLKDLKKTIEEELTKLKSIEKKKEVYDTEIKKIKDLESAQEDVEKELNNLITSNT